MIKLRQPVLSSAFFAAIFFALTGAHANNNASEVYVDSGAQRVELIELYTSEGCSSCPPAEQWLSDFVDNEDLWQRVVPLAFHVDYWDYIGWTDRFADAEFTDRQRDHAARLGMRTIYTPGMFLSGAEWQRWRRSSAEFEPKAASGQLDAVINTDAGAITARFVAQQAAAESAESAESNEKLVLHTAILGFDLSSEVDRGENKGRLLNHDFVVLGYQQTQLNEVEQSEQSPEALLALEQHPLARETTSPAATYYTEASLPDTTETAPRLAIALWVSHANSTEPLQATGGWL